MDDVRVASQQISIRARAQETVWRLALFRLHPRLVQRLSRNRDRPLRRQNFHPVNRIRPCPIPAAACQNRPLFILDHARLQRAETEQHGFVLLIHAEHAAHEQIRQNDDDHDSQAEEHDARHAHQRLHARPFVFAFGFHRSAFRHRNQRQGTVVFQRLLPLRRFIGLFLVFFHISNPPFREDVAVISTARRHWP